jgi:hypothetical protein
MQSTRPDPARRYPNVGAFADALSKFRDSRRPGEVVRFMNSLCQDLLDKQKSALVRTSIAPASWRPTVHPLDPKPEVAIPRAPRAIGFAAFKPTLPPAELPHVEVTVDSGRAVDALLSPPSADASPAPSMPTSVDVPVTDPLGGMRDPAVSSPLLLVNKLPAGSLAPTAASSAVSATDLGAELEYPKRRRAGPILFVLLVFGGAIAIGVVAVQRLLEGPRTEGPLALPAASASAAPAASDDDVADNPYRDPPPATSTPSTSPAPAASGDPKRDYGF